MIYVIILVYRSLRAVRKIANVLIGLAYWLGLGAVGWSICWLMLRSDHSRTAYYFIGNHASLAVWLISQILIMYAVTDEQLWISYRFGNIGIAFTGTFWLLFSLNYSGKRTPAAFVVLMSAVSVFFIAMIFTNPYHKLYYTEFSLDGVSYGPAFYIGQAYIYTVFIAGLYLIGRHCFKRRSRPRSQGALIIAAAIIPLVFNLISVSQRFGDKVAATPLTFAVSGLLVLLATYRYDFLNVNGVAFEDAFNSIAEGVMVFNRWGRSTYISSAAKRLLGVDGRVKLDEIQKLCADDSAEITEDGRTISIKRYRCYDSKGFTIAHIAVVSDITHYYELLDRTAQLAEAERSLALEQERNRIAQEVHDTAGHTLTMITSLARLSQAAAGRVTGEGAAELAEYLRETETLSRSGVTQLRCSINNLRDDSFLKSVTGAVRMLCDSVRDMTAELCVQGEEDEGFGFCIREVYDSCRELVTNSMRYSSADRIDVILRFGESALELFYFDNGGGCGNIKEGNGLRGIRERTERLGGSVSFSSGEGEGFQAVIKIPKRDTAKEVTA